MNLKGYKQSEKRMLSIWKNIVEYTHLINLPANQRNFLLDMIVFYGKLNRESARFLYQKK